MACSLLLPSLFFARLYWHDMGPTARVGIVSLLLFGVCMLVLIVTLNLRALLQLLRCTRVGGIVC